MEKSDHDANTDAEDEVWIKVAIGSSRSSTIGAFWRELDNVYSQRSTVGVQEQSDPSDEDTDVRADSGLGPSSDVGEVDGEPGGQADDPGESESPPESIRTEADEGAPGPTDHVEEQTSGTDVESAPAERTEPESDERESEQVPSRFYFAPLQHSRGDYFD